MKKSLIFTYGLLILLTVTTALISNATAISKIVISLIMGLSAIKFILVAFQFMELKKANSFWKVSLGLVLGLMVLMIVMIHS
jgi:heme/copper-type cytochrome/quinol oxidase subunit 4